MLTEKQVNEIKDHLNKAQNPIFFFDNDPDGLCSFLLLHRYFKNGKGVPIKGSIQNISQYFRKVEEFGSDYIFILDKPEIPRDFFDKAKELNLPVVWIDHHFLDPEKIPSEIYYYNPISNNLIENDAINIFGEPVTALCYQITQKKEDIWIAVVGCVSDMYLPDFYQNFIKEYPDLGLEGFEKINDLYYKSGIGTLIKLMSNGLKDKTTNVIRMLKFLIEVKNPYEVINESDKNRFFHLRSREIESKKRKLIEKAIEVGRNSSEGKPLFFEYRGDLSISSDLSNELMYLFPNKTVAVVYSKGEGESNISIRGEKARDILLNILNELEGAVGGGHEKAVGAKIKTEDLDFFKKRFYEEIESINKA